MAANPPLPLATLTSTQPAEIVAALNRIIALLNSGGWSPYAWNLDNVTLGPTTPAAATVTTLTVNSTSTFKDTVSVSSGLANSLTLAGSATNPTIGTSGGNLNFTPTNGRMINSVSNGPAYTFTDTALGTDLKNFEWASSGGVLTLRAGNDALNAFTNAYQLTRGTTYNVASHTWYTSTVAGTPVTTMALSMSSSKTNLTITPPTSSAGLATGTIWSNAGVANFV